VSSAHVAETPFEKLSRITTMEVLLFTEKNIQIFYDESEQWLYTNWIGFQSTKLVMDGCETMLKLLKENNCQKVLNDNTLVEGIWSGAARWGASSWFPRMRDAGLEWFAWIYSPSVLSQLSTDKTLSLMEPDFIRTFYDLEEARNWLRSV
jgi:hypothetical protein